MCRKNGKYILRYIIHLSYNTCVPNFDFAITVIMTHIEAIKLRTYVLRNDVDFLPHKVPLML